MVPMKKGTYPLEITMDHSVFMEVCEPLSGVRQLERSNRYQTEEGRVKNRDLQARVGLLQDFL
jgi:hypothetical protein